MGRKKDDKDTLLELAEELALLNLEQSREVEKKLDKALKSAINYWNKGDADE